MKYGIYYAYWEKEWGGDYIPYIEKVKNLGFDILEVSCAGFDTRPDADFQALRTASERHGIILTGNYGPLPAHNMASPDPAVVANAFRFYESTFRKMNIAGIRSIGGALNSYWPVDYNSDIDKAGDWQRSIAEMKRLADLAGEWDITLNVEVLNRFEGYMLNEAAEAKTYVQAVAKPNVKVLLDTFHMNIEEESIEGAIHLMGPDLGHLHVGEMNRKPPQEGRMPWRGIAAALHDIGYNGNVVMEPFTQTGGQVGHDIKVWRDLTGGTTREEMDAAVARSLRFLRGLFEK